MSWSSFHNSTNLIIESSWLGLLQSCKSWSWWGIVSACLLWPQNLGAQRSGWQKKPERDVAISKFDWENQMFYSLRCGVQVGSCLPSPTVSEFFISTSPTGWGIQGKKIFHDKLTWRNTGANRSKGASLMENFLEVSYSVRKESASEKGVKKNPFLPQISKQLNFFSREIQFV